MGTLMARYRNQTDPQPPGTMIAKSYDGVVLYNNVVSKPALLSRQMSDEVIPDFHLRRNRGEIFNNPFWSSIANFVSNDVYQGANTRKSDGAKDSTIFANGAFLTSLFNSSSLAFPSVSFDTTNAAATAATKCLADVNSTEVDSLVFAAEWSKTRRLHRDLGNALYKLFTEEAKIRTKRFRTQRIPLYDLQGQPLLKRNGKPRYKYSRIVEETSGRGSSTRTVNASNVYLSIRMGLLPLLSDLEGACRILADNKSLRRTARGQVNLQETKSTVQMVDIAYGQRAAVQLSTTKTLTLRYGILYETTMLMRRLAQLGVTRPLSSAWEAMPWSFVVDWFLSVGSWLDAIQPSGAHKNLAAWVSSRETIVLTASVNAALSYNGGDFSWASTWSGGLTRTVTSNRRDPWVPTMPTHPLLGEGFNKTRSFYFAALILQRLPTKI